MRREEYDLSEFSDLWEKVFRFSGNDPHKAGKWLLWHIMSYQYGYHDEFLQDTHTVIEDKHEDHIRGHHEHNWHSYGSCRDFEVGDDIEISYYDCHCGAHKKEYAKDRTNQVETILTEADGTQHRKITCFAEEGAGI